MKNKFRPETASKESKKRFSSENNTIGKTFQSIIDGTFLTGKNVVKSLPFIVYLVFIAIMYIANTFFAEKNIRYIETTKKELKELRSEYLSLKSKVMEGRRQSAVAYRVRATGIKEAVRPPYKIIDKTIEK